MRLLAIDPGKVTGCVLADFSADLPRVLEAWEADADRLDVILPVRSYTADVVAVEMPVSAGLGRTDGGGVGMRVQPLLDTAVLCGRILERCPDEIPALQVTRREVVEHFGVHHGKGNRDSRIRTYLLLKYGGERKALGTTKEPGPLHSLRSSGGHLWAAFALAVAAESKARQALRKGAA